MSDVIVRPSPFSDDYQPLDELPPELFDALRQQWATDAVDAARAAHDTAVMRIGEMETKIATRLGSLIESEVARRLSDADQCSKRQLQALRDEMNEQGQRHEQECASLGEQVRLVREEGRTSLTQALGQLQLMVQSMYQNAPQPIVNVPEGSLQVFLETHQSAAPIVNMSVPPEAFQLVMPETERQIEYDEHSRPVRIKSKSLAKSEE